MDTYDEEVVQFFLNHPTLEPAITLGNESLIAQALSEIGLHIQEPVTPQAVDSLFQGTGRTHKGEFAYAVAAQIDTLLASGDVPSVPAHVDALFAYLLPTEPTPGTPSDVAPPAD